MDRKLTEGEYCTLSHADLFRNASHAVDSLAREYGYRGHLLGKTQSVGVQGDFRTYFYVAEVRGHYDPETLAVLATRIPNEIPGVNRVVYRI